MDRGACYLTPDGSEPILLSQGGIALLPSGIGHAVSDAGERPVRPFGEIFGGTLEGMSPAGLIVEGGEGPLKALLCAACLLESAPRHPFTASLPDAVHRCGRRCAAGAARCGR
ncbi:cupin domain-containing protein [Streptomyces sp. R39]|uniref:Cupin domain-containing protein n=1 Tax=Streptomyces sp. R39 TaxID=3238631 RepID=A0AB39QW50_9ACTN